MGEPGNDINDPEVQLSELVRRAARGEDVILTDGGEPVVRIVPIRCARGPRQFGSAKGWVHIADDFDDLIFSEAAPADGNRDQAEELSSAYREWRRTTIAKPKRQSG